MPRRLSLHEYEQSKEISAKGYDFYAILSALFRQADTDNLRILRTNWPDIYESFLRRYNSPMGVVEEWDGFTAEEYYRQVEAWRAAREGDEAGSG